ncbi:hypothetical protein [Haliscomenobacter sp.]|uniref:hypothetical protein n=1 Tax=Haliscomenobacter sp. TaxID=2717303 RepID=UPI003364D89E
MKNTFLILICALGMALGNAFAQEQQLLLGLGEVQVSGGSVTSVQKTAVQGKLRTMLAATGFSAEALQVPVVVQPELQLMEPRAVETGTKTLYVIDANLTYTVKQKEGNPIFGAQAKRVSGSGTSTALALSNLISNLPMQDAKFNTFVAEMKTEIMDYYSKQCQNLIAESNRLVETGQYAKAYGLLSNIPIESACSSTASAALKAVYQKQRDAICTYYLLQAKSSAAAKQYDQTLQALKKIDGDAPCAKEAFALAESLKDAVDADVKANLDALKEYYKAQASQNNWNINVMKDYFLHASK